METPEIAGPDITGKLVQACDTGSLETIKGILTERPSEINKPVVSSETIHLTYNSRLCVLHLTLPNPFANQCGMPLICRVARRGHMKILAWLLAQRITFKNATNKVILE